MSDALDWIKAYEEIKHVKAERDRYREALIEAHDRIVSGSECDFAIRVITEALNAAKPADLMSSSASGTCSQKEESATRSEDMSPKDLIKREAADLMRKIKENPTVEDLEKFMNLERERIKK